LTIADYAEPCSVTLPSLLCIGLTAFADDQGLAFGIQITDPASGRSVDLSERARRRVTADGTSVARCTGMRRVIVLAGLTLAINPGLFAGADRSPCAAYGRADAVFIGEAGPPVRRQVPPDLGWRGSRWVLVSPVTVERGFRGVPSPAVVFIVPNGMEYLSPGERYLVYGHRYAGPDIFATNESDGTKRVADATDDLEFLDVIAANTPGATISGVLELDASDSTHIGRDVSPMANIALRLTAGEHHFESRTTVDGHFHITGLPSGTYTAVADLPGDLILSNDPSPMADVLAGGCASLRLRAVPNGHIQGMVRRGGSQLAVTGSVWLLPAELKLGETDRYSQYVEVDRQGRFVFERVRPGAYLLEFSDLDALASYYPGTPDRQAATVIVVQRSGTQDVGEFRVPSLPRH
jgi:hypothetical protein